MTRQTTIAVRFTTKDSETVRRALESMGKEGERALKGIDRAAKAARPSTKALVAVADELRTGIEGAGRDIPGLSNGLRALGPLGTVAAAGLGLAAAGALSLARGALEAGKRAADLVDETQRLGIGVEAFQELKFAADESGVAIDRVGPALDGLNSSIGAIKAGLGDVRKMNAFAEIGITRDQVMGFASLEQALPVIADGLARVQKQAERVRIAEALGVRDLLPVLEQGGSGLNRMAARARELGLVIDESLIRRADEANREIEIATGQMGVAFEEFKLAALPAIVEILHAVTALIQELTRLEQQLNVLRNLRFWSNSVRDDVAAVRRFAGEVRDAGVVGGALMLGNAAQTVDRYAGQARRARARPGTRDADPVNKSGRGSKDLSGLMVPVQDARILLASTGADVPADAAARIAADAALAAGDSRSFEALSRARLDLLRAMERMAATTEGRAEVARAIAEEELAQQEMAIAAQEGIADAVRQQQLAALRAGHAATMREIAETEQAELARAAADRAREDEQAARIQQDRDQASARLLEEAADIELDAARDAAITRQQQLEVDLATLELAFRRRRAEVEATDASEEARAVALAALDRAQAAAAGSLARRHETGLARRRRDLESEAADINGMLGEIADGGLAELETGLAAVLSGTKSVEEAFSGMAASILADLAALAARQWILLPLMQMLGLGGPATGGGFGGFGGFRGLPDFAKTGGALKNPGAAMLGAVAGSLIPSLPLPSLMAGGGFGAGTGAGGLNVRIFNAPAGTTARLGADGALEVLVGRIAGLEQRLAGRERSFAGDVSAIILDGIRRKRF